MRDANPKHLEHFNQQVKLSEVVNRTVKANNEKYLKKTWKEGRPT